MNVASSWWVRFGFQIWALFFLVVIAAGLIFASRSLNSPTLAWCFGYLTAATAWKVQRFFGRRETK